MNLIKFRFKLFPKKKLVQKDKSLRQIILRMLMKKIIKKFLIMEMVLKKELVKTIIMKIKKQKQNLRKVMS